MADPQSKGQRGLVDTDKTIKAVYFQTASGREPVRDWLNDDFSEDERKIIAADVKTVEYGWPISLPISRPFEGGLHEVRSSLPGNRMARVLFCVEEGRMILLHGFIRKTGATPKADLDLAKGRKEEDRIMRETEFKAGAGSGFDAFLREKEIYVGVQDAALQRVLVWQIKEAMKEGAITRAEMARRMNTSQSQLDRFLGAKNDHLDLATLAKAAEAVGRKLSVKLVV